MKKEDKLGIPETRQHARKRKQKQIRNWIIGILAVVCAIAAAQQPSAHIIARSGERSMDTTLVSGISWKDSFRSIILGSRAPRCCAVNAESVIGLALTSQT